MSDVFISYSRKDGQFVQQLNTALVEENRVVWVDWQGIPAGEDWWVEIIHGIENAETFVTVISSNWLTSEICHQELEHALHNNKRVIPLIHQQVDGDIEKRVKGDWMDKPYEQLARSNWDQIRQLNWIFVDSDDSFKTGFTRLLAAIDEDQPHLKAHTRYQRRALEWKRSNENPSFLLLGDDLIFAEKWLETAKQEDKTPHPTDLHQHYIESSRRLEDAEQQRERSREQRVKQLRLASVVLAIIGGIAIIATLVAIPTSINAQNSNATSIAQISTASNILVTSTSVAEQVATGNANLANAVEAQEDTLSQVTSIAQQVETSDANLADAQEQVAIAGETLTPIAPTLTSVAGDLSVALDSQAQAVAEVTIIAEQVATSDANLIDAQEQIVVAGETLTPIAPTLTAVATALSGAIDAQDDAIAEVTAIAEQVIIAGETLTPVPPTLTAVAQVVQKTQNELDISNQSAQALQRVRSGFVGEALIIMNNLVQKYPNEVNAYLERAYIYRQIGQSENAYADYTTAIELVPDRAETYNVRSFVLRDLGQVDEAENDLNKAIDLEPDSAHYYTNRSSFYSTLGNYELALIDINYAITLSPENDNNFVTRAGIYSNLERVDDAFVDYTTAIELNPNNTNAYNSRANIYSHRAEYDLALADLNRAIELEPQQANYYNNRSFVYQNLGDLDSALADLNRAMELESPPNTSQFLARGLLYLNLEQPESAITDFTRYIEMNPEDPGGYDLRGVAYTDAGLYDLALADYDYIMNELTAEGLMNVTAVINQGWAYFKLGDLERALENNNRVLSAIPDEVFALGNRGLIYLVQGQLESAFADYQMMVDIQLNNPPYPDTNIIDLATTDISNVITENPDVGTYYMIRGYLHYMNGEQIRANEDWTQASSLGAQFLPEIDKLRQ